MLNRCRLPGRWLDFSDDQLACEGCCVRWVGSSPERCHQATSLRNVGDLSLESDTYDKLAVTTVSRGALMSAAVLVLQSSSTADCAQQHAPSCGCNGGVWLTYTQEDANGVVNPMPQVQCKPLQR
jgi:hypothetical protein